MLVPVIVGEGSGFGTTAPVLVVIDIDCILAWAMFAGENWLGNCSVILDPAGTA